MAGKCRCQWCALALPAAGCCSLLNNIFLTEERCSAAFNRFSKAAAAFSCDIALASQQKSSTATEQRYATKGFTVQAVSGAFYFKYNYLWYNRPRQGRERAGRDGVGAIPRVANDTLGEAWGELSCTGMQENFLRIWEHYRKCFHRRQSSLFREKTGKLSSDIHGMLQVVQSRDIRHVALLFKQFLYPFIATIRG